MQRSKGSMELEPENEQLMAENGNADLTDGLSFTSSLDLELTRPGSAEAPDQMHQLPSTEPLEKGTDRLLDDEIQQVPVSDQMTGGVFVVKHQDYRPTDKPFKRKCLNILFNVKCLLSFLMAVGAIGYQVYMVYDMHIHRPRYIPPPPVPVFDPTRLDGPECAWDASKRSRVEPPDSTFFWGFNLQWDRDTPRQVVERLGRRPSIFK